MNGMNWRDTALGCIGAVLGGLMTTRWIFGKSAVAPKLDLVASTGYSVGLAVGHALGIAMLVIGLYCLLKKNA
jgi:uncharacterized membrane protein YeaQ/YmgE (transglycosylase-associated protein family)